MKCGDIVVELRTSQRLYAHEDAEALISSAVPPLCPLTDMQAGSTSAVDEVSSWIGRRYFFFLLSAALGSVALAAEPLNFIHIHIP